MQEITVGEAIRMMAREALKSEDMFFEYPTGNILCAVLGKSPNEVDAEAYANPRSVLTQLKNSYITTTTARMPELRDNDLRVKAKFKTYGFKEFEKYDIEDEDCRYNLHPDADKNGVEYLQMKIVKGAVKLGSRGSNDIKDEMLRKKIESEVIDKVISLIGMINPDLSKYQDDSIMRAVLSETTSIKETIVKVIKDMEVK